MSSYLQHVENMRIEWRAFNDNGGWYVVTSNDFPVRGPFTQKEHAQLSLAHIRRRAEEDPEG